MWEFTIVVIESKVVRTQWASALNKCPYEESTEFYNWRLNFGIQSRIIWVDIDYKTWLAGVEL